MTLSVQQISEAIKNGSLQINPFEEDQVQGATYDLHVGDQGATILFLWSFLKGYKIFLFSGGS